MRNKPKRGIRLGFVLLEVRFVLSGIRTTDPDPDPPSQLVDECTLRAAIEQANATEGYQTIGFASHSVGSGSFVVNSEGDASDSDLSDNKCWTGAQISPSTVEKIVPGSPYDPITDPAAIDATPQGSFGNPNVEIDGSQTTDAHGFALAADTSLISRSSSSPEKILDVGSPSVDGIFAAYMFPERSSRRDKFVNVPPTSIPRRADISLDFSF